ncbi:MAG: DUF4346 domain-containing protein [Snowella sp.]|nr:DUF4346 domain-containing protein [Snowella sp.]
MVALLPESIKTIDDKLSNRYIDLDPGGYWIIYVDHEAQVLGVKHFTNNINEQGLAVDPETGEVIPCKGPVERKPTVILTARTAKEMCVQLFESDTSCPVTMLNHAAYLGRELVRAEYALINGTEYIQD